jgi:long-chain-fatty-acid---luciferin-component ligase
MNNKMGIRERIMRGMRPVMASLPIPEMISTVLDMAYWRAVHKNNYIDQLVRHPKFMFLKPDELKDMQTKAIRQAFKHHYNDCEFYHNQCKSIGVKPNDIHSFNDITKIPQIPSETFKQGGILSVPENKILTVVTTSGTSGLPSFLARDITSIERIIIELIRYIIDFCYPIAANIVGREMKDYYRYCMNNWHVGLFIPSIKESSSWMNQISNYAGFLAPLFAIPFDIYLKEMKFDPAEIFKKIKETHKQDKMIFLVGFHYIINEMMNYMDEIGETLDLDPTGKNVCGMLLAGGWKKLSGEEVDKRAFKKRVKEHFGITERFILDIYGFAESNMLACDFCPDGKVHGIMSSLLVTRDPDTLEVQDFGEKGLISVYDPTMNTYPAFVITDDLGRISEPHICEGCGMTTQDIEYLGRAPKAELRSCGLRTQQILTDKDKKGLEMLRMKTPEGRK